MKFKKEQRAWSSHFGWGTIYHILDDSDYPVKYIADLDNITVSYLADGREFKNDLFPTLFHKEQKLDLGEPEIEIGTLGYFWHDGTVHCATLGLYGGLTTPSKKHIIKDGHYYWDNFCAYPELPPQFKK